MVEMTQSLKRYMWEFHRKEYALVLFGHTEIVDEYWDDYISWCRTDEGRSYLEGGINYMDGDAS